MGEKDLDASCDGVIRQQLRTCIIAGQELQVTRIMVLR